MSEPATPHTTQVKTTKEKVPAKWYSLAPWALAVGGLFWAFGIIMNGLRYIRTEPLESAVPKTMGALIGGLIFLVVLYGLAWLIALVCGKRRICSRHCLWR